MPLPAPGELARSGRGVPRALLFFLHVLQDGEPLGHPLHAIRLGVRSHEVATVVLGGERGLVQLAIVDRRDVQERQRVLGEVVRLQVGGDGLGELTRGLQRVRLLGELLGRHHRFVPRGACVG